MRAKKINNIKNKMLNGVKVVYRSSKLRTTPLIQAFTDEWSIVNRIDKGIIPQIKGLEYSRGNQEKKE